jgi:hypothetical protein
LLEGIYSFNCNPKPENFIKVLDAAERFEIEALYKFEKLRAASPGIL